MRGRIRQILTVNSAVLAKSDAKRKRLHEHGKTTKTYVGGTLSKKMPFFGLQTYPRDLNMKAPVCKLVAHSPDGTNRACKSRALKRGWGQLWTGSPYYLC